MWRKWNYYKFLRQKFWSWQFERRHIILLHILLLPVQTRRITWWVWHPHSLPFYDDDGFIIISESFLTGDGCKDRSFISRYTLLATYWMGVSHRVFSIKLPNLIFQSNKIISVLSTCTIVHYFPQNILIHRQADRYVEG